MEGRWNIFLHNKLISSAVHVSSIERKQYLNLIYFLQTVKHFQMLILHSLWLQTLKHLKYLREQLGTRFLLSST